MKKYNKPHVYFTQEEDNAITRGVKTLGEGKWLQIIKMFPTELSTRGRVQIRGQWRKLQTLVTTTTPTPDPPPLLPSPLNLSTSPTTMEYCPTTQQLVIVGNDISLKSTTPPSQIPLPLLFPLRCVFRHWSNRRWSEMILL